MKKLIPLRNRLLTRVITVCSVFVFTLQSHSIAAATERQMTQAPGFYRMALGDIEVTALYDGYTQHAPEIFKGASSEEIQTLLAKKFNSPTKGSQTAINSYLINTGTNLILIDTGKSGPTSGHLLKNLQAAGYHPEQVDMILLTHLHSDHVGGLLTPEGTMVFPNAQIFVSKVEADYWLNPDIAAKAPANRQLAFTQANAAIAPYKAKGKFHTFAANEVLIAGITAIPTPGHTPGHTSYLVSSKQQHLLVWGDIIHNYALQFSHPQITASFDMDGREAVITRGKLLHMAAAESNFWIAGAHLPFPGMGRVRAEKPGYVWVPIEYAPITQP